MVRLFVDYDKHSSTAELVHNHSVQSGEKERNLSPSLLFFSLTALRFFTILLFSAALECFSGAERYTIVRFGSAPGLFTVYMIWCV